jgi:hypothetical protein
MKIRFLLMNIFFPNSRNDTDLFASEHFNIRPIKNGYSQTSIDHLPIFISSGRKSSPLATFLIDPAPFCVNKSCLSLRVTSRFSPSLGETQKFMATD